LRPVDLPAANHVLNLETAAFAEGHVLDPELLDLGQVTAGGEATIKAGLTRGLAEELLVPLDHLDREGRVSGVALLDDRIGDETGSATGQAQLVAELSLAVVFDDNIGVRLRFSAPAW